MNSFRMTLRIDQFTKQTRSLKTFPSRSMRETVRDVAKVNSNREGGCTLSSSKEKHMGSGFSHSDLLYKYTSNERHTANHIIRDTLPALEAKTCLSTEA